MLSQIKKSITNSAQVTENRFKRCVKRSAKVLIKSAFSATSKRKQCVCLQCCELLLVDRAVVIGTRISIDKQWISAWTFIY